MRTFRDADGHAWDVMIGRESWGTLVLLFSPREGGEVRQVTLGAETPLAASTELDALDDERLRALLRDAQPWG